MQKIFFPYEHNAYLCTPLGEMLEWLKRHAWKVCVPVKGYPGFESLFLRIKLKPALGAGFVVRTVPLCKAIEWDQVEKLGDGKYYA